MCGYCCVVCPGCVHTFWDSAVSLLLVKVSLSAFSNFFLEMRHSSQYPRNTQCPYKSLTSLHVYHRIPRRQPRDYGTVAVVEEVGRVVLQRGAGVRPTGGERQRHLSAAATEAVMDVAGRTVHLTSAPETSPASNAE